MEKEGKIKTGFADIGMSVIIVLLRACEIVKQDIYSKLLGVNKKRCQVVHRVTGRFVLDKEEAEKTIKDAIEGMRGSFSNIV